MWKADLQIACLHRIYRGKRGREEDKGEDKEEDKEEDQEDEEDLENQCCVCLYVQKQNEICEADKNETQCKEFCRNEQGYEEDSLEYKACVRRYKLHRLSCGHIVCEKCKFNMIQRGQTQCPYCRQETLIDSYLELGLAEQYVITFVDDDDEEDTYEGTKWEIKELLRKKFSEFRFEEIRLYKAIQQSNHTHEVHKEYDRSYTESFNSALDDLYNDDFTGYQHVYLQVHIGFTPDGSPYQYDSPAEFTIKKKNVDLYEDYDDEEGDEYYDDEEDEYDDEEEDEE